MNKYLIISTLLICGLIIKQDLTLIEKNNQVKRSILEASNTNNYLKGELAYKSKFEKKQPLTLKKTYENILNQIKLLESYNDSRITLVMEKSESNKDLSKLLKDTKFSSIKALPMIIEIQNQDKTSDVSSLINDIYMIEKQNDFKINELTVENNLLVIKGEIYGVQ